MILRSWLAGGDAVRGLRRVKDGMEGGFFFGLFLCVPELGIVGFSRTVAFLSRGGLVGAMQCSATLARSLSLFSVASPPEEFSQATETRRSFRREGGRETVCTSLQNRRPSRSTSPLAITKTHAKILSFSARLSSNTKRSSSIVATPQSSLLYSKQLCGVLRRH